MLTHAEYTHTPRYLSYGYERERKMAQLKSADASILGAQQQPLSIEC
jgi:hypothetical protein